MSFCFRMTSVLCSRVSSVAARFSELLSASANMLESTQVDHNDVNLLITNVFLEVHTFYLLTLQWL